MAPTISNVQMMYKHIAHQLRQGDCFTKIGRLISLATSIPSRLVERTCRVYFPCPKLLNISLRWSNTSVHSFCKPSILYEYEILSASIYSNAANSTPKSSPLSISIGFRISILLPFVWQQIICKGGTDCVERTALGSKLQYPSVYPNSTIPSAWRMAFASVNQALA